MKRAFLTLLGVASAVALSTTAQAGPSISTDTAPGANLGAYRTYTWANTQAPQGVNPVMFQRITDDFDSSLSQRGYQKGAPGDLSLVLTIGEQNKTDVETWGRFGLQTSVYQYTQGQLSIDVFDTKTKQALWHGQASGTVNPDNPKASRVDAAIEKLMLKFPGTAAPAKP